MEIRELLGLTHRSGASDLHLSAGEPPRIRLNGDMKRLDHPALSADELAVMLDGIMSEGQRRTFAETSDVDFSLDLGGVARFRVNVFRGQRGPGAVFRTIPNQIRTLDDLGLPAILKEVCDRPKGLVLVTGPTGSGKSTTLAAMVDHVNSRLDGHILTIEDPIEFVHESKKSLVNQREVGPHSNSFATALRAALREDPDVILVGEMRDLDTISLALTAAETGHLVFATLHTSSAAKTIDRVIDVFPAAQQEQVRVMFAESMQAIVCQTLLKKKSGGRVAATEILLATPAIRNLIREGKGHQIPSAIQTGQKLGMQTLEGAVADLVRRGVVSPEEAQARVPAQSTPVAPPGGNGAASAGLQRPAMPGNGSGALRA